MTCWPDTRVTRSIDHDRPRYLYVTPRTFLSESNRDITYRSQAGRLDNTGYPRICSKRHPAREVVIGPPTLALGIEICTGLFLPLQNAPDRTGLFCLLHPGTVDSANVIHGNRLASVKKVTEENTGIGRCRSNPPDPLMSLFQLEPGRTLVLIKSRN